MYQIFCLKYEYPGPGAFPRTGLRVCRLIFLNRSRPEEELICSICDDEKRKYVQK